MAETTTKKSAIEEVPHLPGGVTNETPAEADKTSMPNAADAKANDPPVRTNRPETPIAQSLADGAGRHLPPDDPHIGADGRFYADTADARAASVGYMSDADLDARFGKAKG
jgi:hypothetical protein